MRKLLVIGLLLCMCVVVHAQRNRDTYLSNPVGGKLSFVASLDIKKDKDMFVELAETIRREDNGGPWAPIASDLYGKRIFQRAIDEFKGYRSTFEKGDVYIYEGFILGDAARPTLHWTIFFWVQDPKTPWLNGYPPVNWFCSYQRRHSSTEE